MIRRACERWKACGFPNSKSQNSSFWPGCGIRRLLRARGRAPSSPRLPASTWPHKSHDISNFKNASICMKLMSIHLAFENSKHKTPSKQTSPPGPTPVGCGSRGGERATTVHLPLSGQPSTAFRRYALAEESDRSRLSSDLRRLPVIADEHSLCMLQLQVKPLKGRREVWVTMWRSWC